MVILSLHPLIVIFLTWYDAILYTIDVLLLKYEDDISGTVNTGCLRETHPNLFLFQGHHVPGIRSQEPLAFCSPIISAGLYKMVEAISRILL